MPPVITELHDPGPSPVACVDQQLLLLENLKSLLDGASRCLAGGDPLPLLALSRQVTSTAQELLALSLQLANPSASDEAQQRRRQLLSDVAKQRAFCRAMLRRWRRSIALRQQLLELGSEPVPYTDSLARRELK